MLEKLASWDLIPIYPEAAADNDREQNKQISLIFIV